MYFRFESLAAVFHVLAIYVEVIASNPQRSFITFTVSRKRYSATPTYKNTRAIAINNLLDAPFLCRHGIFSNS